MNQHPSLMTSTYKTRYLKLGQIRLEIYSLEAKIAWFQSQLALLKEQEDLTEGLMMLTPGTLTLETESGI